MDLTLVAALSGTLGVTAGAGALWAFRVAQDRRNRPALASPPELPSGVGEVLVALRSAAVVLDVSDHVVKASPAAYAQGLVRGDVVVQPALLAIVRKVREQGATLEQDLVLPRGPLGEGTIVVHARAAPLGALHILLLIEDRTEARRVEAVRRDFVANVSHELKTPVGGISLLSEAIVDAADDPAAVRRFAARMGRESQRLSDLVQDIIDFSRLQVGEGVDGTTLVSIDDVVAEALDRIRVLAEGREITVAQGELCSAQVYGDRSLLVTAVRNLVDNAIRYSDAGTRVAVGCRLVDSLVLVSVVDQGIGISEGELDRVFERFYRVDPARSRQTGGTGLGLSIVKHVAANHGGDVTVWSSPGHGSTFTLRLPVAQRARATGQIPTDSASKNARMTPEATPLREVNDDTHIGG